MQLLSLAKASWVTEGKCLLKRIRDLYSDCHCNRLILCLGESSTRFKIISSKFRMTPKRASWTFFLSLILLLQKYSWNQKGLYPHISIIWKNVYPHWTDRSFTTNLGHLGYLTQAWYFLTYEELNKEHKQFDHTANRS